MLFTELYDCEKNLFQTRSHWNDETFHVKKNVSCEKIHTAIEPNNSSFL